VPEPMVTQEVLPVTVYDRASDLFCRGFPFESKTLPFTLTAEPTAVNEASIEIERAVDVGVGVGVGIGLGLV
jgi:hypothetical protein